MVMININFKKIVSYLIVFALGFCLGWYVFSGQEIIEKITVKEKIVEKTDTLTITKTIYTKTPATTLIVTSTPDPQSGGAALPSAFEEEVAHWDTLTEDGFSADINFFKRQNLFENSFVIPERIITKEKTITKEIEKETTITKLPAYVFAVGVNLPWEDSQIKVLPFLSLTANEKFLFINYSIELKTLADIKQNGFTLIPEVEGAINIPFN